MANPTITLTLGGCVNGAPVDLTGRAELDLNAGRLDLELASRATPLHWDPALGMLGLLDAVRAVAGFGGCCLRLTTTILRRRAGVCDDQGRQVGEVVLSLVVRALDAGGSTSSATRTWRHCSGPRRSQGFDVDGREE